MGSEDEVCKKAAVRNEADLDTRPVRGKKGGGGMNVVDEEEEEELVNAVDKCDR